MVNESGGLGKDGGVVLRVKRCYKRERKKVSCLRVTAGQREFNKLVHEIVLKKRKQGNW